MSEDSGKDTEQRKGRPPSASLNDIIQAGLALEKDGKPVTGHALRKQLGDRGRPEYLLRQWTEHRASWSTSSLMSQSTLPPDGATSADNEESVPDELRPATTGPQTSAPVSPEHRLDDMIASHLTASLEKALQKRGELEVRQRHLRRQGSPDDQRSSANRSLSSGSRTTAAGTSKSSDAQESPSGERADHVAENSKTTDDGNGGIRFLLQRLEYEWTAVGRLSTNCQWLRKRLKKAPASQGSQYVTNAKKDNALNKPGSPQTPASGPRTTPARSYPETSARATKRQQMPASQNQQTGDRHHERHATGPVTAAVERTGADAAPLQNADARKRNPTHIKQKPAGWSVLKQILEFILRRSVRIGLPEQTKRLRRTKNDAALAHRRGRP